MEKVIIYGTGEYAEIVHYYLSRDSRFDVVAFCVESEFKNENSFCKLDVLKFEDIENHFSPQDYKMFIAIGYSKMNIAREQKYLDAKNKGYGFITYINPRTFVADNVEIGENCFILEDSTIQPFAKIGHNTIVWSGTHIGTRATVKENCFISSHVGLGGSTIVEKNSFLGLNSTIRDHLNIAKYTIVGAGAVILSDTEENKVYKAQETIAMNYESKKLKNI